MSKIFPYVCLLFMLLVPGPIPAMSRMNADLMTLTGTIRVTGSEPLSRVVLTTDPQHGRGEVYLVVGPLEYELRQRSQGRRVTLVGRFCSSPSPQFPHCFEAIRLIGR